MKAILLKDIKLALRSGNGSGLAIAFFIVYALLVPLGVGSSIGLLEQLGHGVLWVGALLACLLTMDRIFRPDFDDGTLERIIAAPVPLEGVVAAKFVAHWVSTGVPLCLIAIPLCWLLNLPRLAEWPLLLSLVVGTPAISALGSLGAAVTIGLRRGNLLLSLLVLPLCIPTLIFGTLTAKSIAGATVTETPFLLLCAITLGSISMIPFASAYALRINLR